MRRRVKITGIGPVTPAGIGREAFYQGINESVSRVRSITRFDPSAGQFMGAEVAGFDLKNYAPNENSRRLAAASGCASFWPDRRDCDLAVRIGSLPAILFSAPGQRPFRN